MTRLSSARLIHRVVIQEQSLVSNGRGGRRKPEGSDGWRDVDLGVFAEIIALRGTEATTSAVTRATQLWRVTIRVRPGINTGMRLVWTDAVLGEVIGNIRAAALNDTRDGVVMTVESEARPA